MSMLEDLVMKTFGALLLAALVAFALGGLMAEEVKRPKEKPRELKESDIEKKARIQNNLERLIRRPLGEKPKWGKR